MAEKNDGHGGARQGAGRKPTGRKPRSIWANDEEWKVISSYADKIRAERELLGRMNSADPEIRNEAYREWATYLNANPDRQIPYEVIEEMLKKFK